MTGGSPGHLPPDARRDGLAALVGWAFAVLDRCSDAVLATRSDGDLVYCNRAAEVLTGRPAGELLGRPLHTVLHLTPRDPHGQFPERA